MANAEIKITAKGVADTERKLGKLGGAFGKLKARSKSVSVTLGKLRTNVLNLQNTVAVAATAFAAKKLFDFIETGANIERQKRAFDSLAASYRASSDQILFDLRRISRGTVDTMSLMNTASKALVLGIAPDKLGKLMEIARAASKATGDTITKSFNDIVVGLARQSRLILDNLGIIIKVEDANKKYAEQLGKTASALSDVEKRQAFLNATLAAGEDIIERVGKDFLSNADRVDIIKASFVDAKNAAASFFTQLILGNQTMTGLDELNIAVQEGRMSIEEAEKAYDRLFAKVTQKPPPLTVDEVMLKRAEAMAVAMKQSLKGVGAISDEQALGRTQQLIKLIEDVENRNRGLAEAGNKVFMSQSRVKELFKKSLPEIKQGFDQLSESEQKAFLAMNRRLGVTARELENIKALHSKLPSSGDRFKTKNVGPDDLFKIGNELERKTVARNARRDRRGVAITKEMRTEQEKLNDRLKELNELRAAGSITQETFNRASKKAIEDFKQLTFVMSDLERNTRNAISGMKGPFTDFFDSTKQGFLSMQSLWANTMSMLRRKAAEAMADKAIKFLMNMAFPGSGGLGGGGGKKGIFGLGGVLGIFHEGGVVGSGGQPTRQLSFAGIPRMHSGGLAADEVPAILQKKEGVLSRKGMANLDKLNLGNAGGGGATTNNFYITMPTTVKTIDSQTAAQFLQSREFSEASTSSLERAILGNHRIRAALKL